MLKYIFCIYLFSKILIEIPSGLAKTPVHPVLGQFGINSGEFVNIFNKVSLSKFVSGVPLVVLLNIKSRGVYTFKLKMPSVKLFIDSISLELDDSVSEYYDLNLVELNVKKLKKKIIEKRNFSLNCSELYDVCFILSEYYNVSIWRMSKVVFGYLFSKKSQNNMKCEYK